jgi:hypothetical protein
MFLEGKENCRYSGLDPEVAMIFNAMFALCSRFSRSPFFKNTPPKQRGIDFAQQASISCSDILRNVDTTTPTLIRLQGLIMLAFYHVTDRPGTSAWLLTGLCCRLAHELALNNFDQDIIEGLPCKQLDALEWVERESVRRAWWSLWELDLFISDVSNRPPAIAQEQMRVLLPVSDQCWFSETPISSNHLRCDPESAWKSLYGSINQDERAWFSVSRYLLWLSFCSKQKPSQSAQARSTVELSISCFALSLPESFQLGRRCTLIFDDDHFSKSNWIMGTHLMLQALVFLIVCLQFVVLTCLSRARHHLRGEPSLGPQLACFGPLESDTANFVLEEYEGVLIQGRREVNDLLKLCTAWPPEYIPFAMPIVACLILGPNAVNIISTASIPDQNAREMLQLTIAQFSKYWDLATLVLSTCPIQKMALLNKHVDGASSFRLCVHDPTTIYFAGSSPPWAKRLAQPLSYALTQG